MSVVRSHGQQRVCGVPQRLLACVIRLVPERRNECSARAARVLEERCCADGGAQSSPVPLVVTRSFTISNAAVFVSVVHATDHLRNPSALRFFLHSPRSRGGRMMCDIALVVVSVFLCDLLPAGTGGTPAVPCDVLK